MEIKFQTIIKIIIGYLVLASLTLKIVQIIVTLPLAYLIGTGIISLYDEYKNDK